jgi:DNA-binding NarL/FixJ family response regulator
MPVAPVPIVHLMDSLTSYTVVIAMPDPGAAVALRQIVQRHPRFDVMREVPNAVMALEACRVLRPDLAIVGDDSPGLRGRDVVDEIRRESPWTRVILVATYDANYLRDVEQVYLAVSIGNPELIESGLDSLAEALDNPEVAKRPERRRTSRRLKQDWTKVFAERRAQGRRNEEVG